jgi:TRAP-type mannitol/chloroaromatic compound transport system permease small subunit
VNNKHMEATCIIVRVFCPIFYLLPFLFIHLYVERDLLKSVCLACIHSIFKYRINLGVCVCVCWGRIDLCSSETLFTGQKNGGRNMTSVKSRNLYGILLELKIFPLAYKYIFLLTVTYTIFAGKHNTLQC